MMVQFYWHVILGKEPVISSMEEFVPFLIYSVVVWGSITFYIRLQKKAPLSIMIFIGLFWIFWWIGGVVDTLQFASSEYPRSEYLNLVRYVGLTTTLLIALYSMLKIPLPLRKRIVWLLVYALTTGFFWYVWKMK